VIDGPATRALDLQNIELANFGQQAVTTATT
jgi:hypothetical protein